MLQKCRDVASVCSQYAGTWPLGCHNSVWSCEIAASEIFLCTTYYLLYWFSSLVWNTLHQLCVCDNDHLERVSIFNDANQQRSLSYFAVICLLIILVWPVQTTPEGPRAVWGFLGGDQEAPSPQLGVYGSFVRSPSGSGAEPRKTWILEHFGTSEITSERSAGF